MNYNLKIEMERINGNVVSNIEVSSSGIARRDRIVSPDFDTAQADLKKKHDELMGQVEAFHAPAPAPSADLGDPGAKVQVPAADKSTKRKASAKAKKKAPAKKAAKAKTKGK